MTVDLSDIPDEAWIDVVAAVGWDESNELWPVLQTALAAALPIVTADLVAEIQQKDADLEEFRTGVLRLHVNAAKADDDARPVCPCVTDDDYVHPSMRGEQ